MRFIFPIDGDCLNSHDGSIVSDRLVIEAKVEASKGVQVFINDREAVYRDGVYTAPVTLYGRRTTIVAKSESETAAIAVYDYRHTENRFRISSDDNILFLKDITDNRDRYNSIFNNPYLAVYKEAHDRYGAKVHLNLFYETDDMTYFNERCEYFNLSMMTDRFKDEWEQNSDWLQLSFHSWREYPPKPYEHSDMTEVREDALRINAEIVRFAGKKTLADVCTVHFGEASIDGVRALRNVGYRALAGYFEIQKNGQPLVAYYYPIEHVKHVGNRDFWVNTKEDVIHARIDLVLNTIKYEQLEPRLSEVVSNPHRAGFLELMIHEQYFYKSYQNYIPRFRDLVVDAAKFAYERGYKGTLLGEII